MKGCSGLLTSQSRCPCPPSGGPPNPSLVTLSRFPLAPVLPAFPVKPVPACLPAPSRWGFLWRRGPWCRGMPRHSLGLWAASGTQQTLSSAGEEGLGA